VSDAVGINLQALDRELAQTQDQFQPLFSPDLLTWPIPFFGQVSKAEVLTVGVNPSIGEFQNKRWEGVSNYTQVVHRLLHYFDNDVFPPHPWFDTWEFALNHIGASYYGKARYLAAHLDLSPRATLPVWKVDDELFFEMVRNDLFSFAQTLTLAKEAMVVLLAGSVTSDYYINHFLSEFLPAEVRLQGSFSSRSQPGPAKVVFHRLITDERDLPVFFCSCSPSDRENRHLLIERVKLHADNIRRLGKL
jgi:hypothetical protein